jgi:DnaJ-class molecular chaperone
MPQYQLPNGEPNPDPYFDDVVAYEVCHVCDGSGAVDTPYSANDPCCPNCGGEGKVAL